MARRQGLRVAWCANQIVPMARLLLSCSYFFGLFSISGCQERNQRCKPKSAPMTYSVREPSAMSSESFMTPVARNQTEVFAIHGANPEVLAYAMAKYSAPHFRCASRWLKSAPSALSSS